jgi:hypothetical protein
MNHGTTLSDMARTHQADLLREAQAQAMFKRAGVTPSAQPKWLLAAAAFVVTVALALAGRMG